MLDAIFTALTFPFLLHSSFPVTFSQFVDIYENHDRIPIDEYLKIYISQPEERAKKRYIRSRENQLP